MTHRSAVLVLVLAAVATGLAAANAEAQDAGSFTLAPGEARHINIGFYREIRVCNDVGSAGSFEMRVSDQSPTQLGPGVCWRDSGDNLALHNNSAGPASGIYSALRGKPGRGGK
jgi:hypothetical protein